VRNPSPRLVWAALLLATLSLALNVALLWSAGRSERWLGPVLLAALERLQAEDATLRVQLRVPVGTPLHADVPLDERVSVRIDTRLPIDTRLRLPIRSPLGSYTVDVPIQADVPVRTVVPLHIRHTLRVRTAVGEEMALPLEVRVRDLPLDALRRSLSH
jgi:hypothetical protein